MTSVLLIAAVLVALASFAGMTGPSDSIGDRVKSAVDALFGGGTTAPRTASPTGTGVTLRFGTLSKFVPDAEVHGRSIGQLFEAYTNDLGGCDIDENTTIRDTSAMDGGVKDAGDTARSGRIYIASVRKENKGK